MEVIEAITQFIQAIISIINWPVVLPILLTAVMCLLTFLYMRSTSKILENQFKPYVIVYVEQRIDAPGFLRIIIENIGTAPAHDILFTLSGNIPEKVYKEEDKNSIMTSGVLIDGLAYLVNGKKVEIDWGRGKLLVETLKEKIYEFIVIFMITKKENYALNHHYLLKDLKI